MKKYGKKNKYRVLNRI